MGAVHSFDRSGSRDPKLLTIGQVLNLLRGEFSDLSSSKLRFLEDQGIVTPQRTDSGYRKFTHTDVERLRQALQMQRDLFLPLKVIKEYFEDLDAGRSPSLPGVVEAKPVRSRTKKLAEIDLVSQSGITDSILAAAKDAKLLGEAPYGVNDVEIAKVLVELQKYGLTSRHLTALRLETERQIGIIEGVIKPVLARKDTASRAKAAYLARQLQELFNTLRDELIDRILGDIDQRPEA